MRQIVRCISFEIGRGGGYNPTFFGKNRRDISIQTNDRKFLAGFFQINLLRCCRRRTNASLKMELFGTTQMYYWPGSVDSSSLKGWFFYSYIFFCLNITQKFIPYRVCWGLTSVIATNRCANVG